MMHRGEIAGCAMACKVLCYDWPTKDEWESECCGWLCVCEWERKRETEGERGTECDVGWYCIVYTLVIVLGHYCVVLILC